MHDVAWFEARGVPSAAILSSAFGRQAHYQAEGLGLTGVGPCLHMVAHPISDQTKEEMHAKADVAFDSIVDSLLHTKGDQAKEDVSHLLANMDEEAFEEACAS